MEHKLRNFHTVMGILLTVRVAVSVFFTMHLAHFTYPIVLYSLAVAAGMIVQLALRWKRQRQIADSVFAILLSVIWLYIVYGIVEYGITDGWNIHALGNGLFRVYDSVSLLSAAGFLWILLAWKESGERFRLGVNGAVLALVALATMFGSYREIRTAAWWGVIVMGIFNTVFVFGAQVRGAIPPRQNT